MQISTQEVSRVVERSSTRGGSVSEAPVRTVQELAAKYGVKMDEVRRHLDNTWFAWIGGTEDNSVFYYRIYSPVILIEFNHQRPANLRPPGADLQAPTRQHIHVVVRTPNGNDYGRDLLRQHHARFDHAHGGHRHA